MENKGIEGKPVTEKITIVTELNKQKEMLVNLHSVIRNIETKIKILRVTPNFNSEDKCKESLDIITEIEGNNMLIEDLLSHSHCILNNLEIIE